MRPTENNRLSLTEALDAYSADYIKDLYCNSTQSLASLAKTLNVSRATLYNILNSYNIEYRQNRYSTKLQDIKTNLNLTELCLDLYTFGFKYVQTKYELSRAYLDRLCTELAIDRTAIRATSNRSNGLQRRTNTINSYAATIASITPEVIEDAYIKYGLIGAVHYLNISRPVLEYYLTNYATDLQEKFNANNNNSFYNILLAEQLTAAGIHYEREFIIAKKRFDFKIDNLLVEIDPMRTHQLASYKKHTRYDCLSLDYHQNKSLLAIKNGYSIMHIYCCNEQPVLELVEFLKNRQYTITHRIVENKIMIYPVGLVTNQQILDYIYNIDNFLQYNIEIICSLDMCSLVLGDYKFEVLSPEIKYMQNNTVVDRRDFNDQNDVYCFADAGSVILKLDRGDYFGELFENR